MEKKSKTAKNTKKPSLASIKIANIKEIAKQVEIIKELKEEAKFIKQQAIEELNEAKLIKQKAEEEAERHRREREQSHNERMAVVKVSVDPIHLLLLYFSLGTGIILYRSLYRMGSLSDMIDC